LKIALDPYMFRRVPLTDLPGLVADLGYSYIELSPREDFLPFFLHPRADKAQIAAFSKALSAAGVQVSSTRTGCRSCTARRTPSIRAVTSRELSSTPGRS
jgi:sugar phosphate isomerase/epimerase